MNKGFIKVSDIIYREAWSDIYIFLKDFRPTHIEFRHWENDIWYLYGVSSKFDPINEGDAIPQHDVMFTKREDGGHDYEFKRVQTGSVAWGNSRICFY